MALVSVAASLGDHQGWPHPRFPLVTSNPPPYLPALCSGFSSEAFQKGGRKGAKKVMIVITDGESHDSPDLEKVIQQSERDNVTRYAVAVSPVLLSSPPVPPLPTGCQLACRGFTIKPLGTPRGHFLDSEQAVRALDASPSKEQVAHLPSALPRPTHSSHGELPEVLKPQKTRNPPAAQPSEPHLRTGLSLALLDRP